VRIALISPFIDRQHGTERAVAELLDRLITVHGDTIDLYAQNVSDLQNVKTSTLKTKDSAGILWHRVPRIPGPYLVQFLGWLMLNRYSRWLQKRTGKVADVLFSPGINALDADVILVHAVFHRVAEIHQEHISNSLHGLHRKIYYALLCSLERRVYTNPHVTLAAVSRHTAEQLARYFGRDDVAVIPNGVDGNYFSPASIAPLREPARVRWKLSPRDFVLLLIGNDWRNKGLHSLLQACSNCKDLSIHVLVVGQDDQTPFRDLASNLGFADLIHFFSPVPDVRNFYAAADALFAPSLEDSFNLPALEAMACGLPVVVSPKAGLSEWLTDGQDSIVLKDPEDVQELCEAIRVLAADSSFRNAIAANAIHTARQFSWDAHASELRKLLAQAAQKKALRNSASKSA
jgi:UDP-glucose:(heptosyl)LPS alpha-1,3-glucosyltransferase